MTNTLTSERVQRVLDSLYADAAQSPFPEHVIGPQAVYPRGSREMFHELRTVYMAIAPSFGQLLYNLVRASKTQNIVEFGTSMGVSTIYLASALKDNGGGKLITTEYEPEKIERARHNLREAGLEELIDFRVGDAMESLKTDLPDPIDLVFLDGAKQMYLDVLKLLEPSLSNGAIIASDNTDHDGVESLLEYLHDPANGYVSSSILTAREDRTSGHEISCICR